MAKHIIKLPPYKAILWPASIVLRLLSWISPEMSAKHIRVKFVWLTVRGVIYHIAFVVPS